MAKWAVPEIVLNDSTNSYAIGEYFTSEDFKSALVRRAYDYIYITPHYYDSSGEEVETCETVAEATENFYADFALWRDSRLPEFTRIYEAINLTYEPIENYDRSETYTLEKHKGSQEEYNVTDKDTGTDGIAHSGTIGTEKTVKETGTDANGHTGTVTNAKTTKETGTDTETHTGTDTTKSESNGSNAQNVYGFNSTDAVPSDTSTVSGTTTDTRTADLTDTDTKNLTTEESNTETFADTQTETKNLTTTDSATQTFNNTDTETKNLEHAKTGTTKYSDQSENVYDHDKYTERTHGNIGVTTSQQMLESELKLRDLIDFKAYIIRDFCRRVLVMGRRYKG